MSAYLSYLLAFILALRPLFYLCSNILVTYKYRLLNIKIGKLRKTHTHLTTNSSLLF
jgi:hypothetical protein